MVLIQTALAYIGCRWTQRAREVVEASLGISEISARTHSVLVRQPFDAAECCVSATSQQVRAIADATSPWTLLCRQATIATELGEDFVGMAQEVLDVEAQARVELGLCVEDGVRALQVSTCH